MNMNDKEEQRIEDTEPSVMETEDLLVSDADSSPDEIEDEVLDASEESAVMETDQVDESDPELESSLDAGGDDQVEEMVEDLPDLEADLDTEDQLEEREEGLEDESEVQPEKEIPAEEEKDDGRAWYVVHCYSGNEDKVRHNIMQRIESMGMDDLIFDVVVPTEDEVNIKDGERQTIEKKVFPGYILVNMILTEESWYMVRNTPGVTGFVGMGNDPTPLQPEEVARILKRMESESPRINVTFRPGERVRIVDGPFEDFYGKVAEIDMERATVRVMVNFFGRETPVELDFLQVEGA
jgi:transcriptional antiterminator NusG